MKIILTTVGTSVLTNFKDLTESNFECFNDFLLDNDFEGKEFQLFSDKFKTIKDEDSKKYKDLKDQIEHIENSINKYYFGFERKNDEWEINIVNINTPNKDLCAEVKTIFEIFKKTPKNENIKIVLFPTHTHLSRLSAKIIKDFFLNAEVKKYIKDNYNSINILDPEIKLVQELKPTEKFENEGLNNLISNIKEIYDKNTENFILTEEFITQNLKGLFSVSNRSRRFKDNNSWNNLENALKNKEITKESDVRDIIQNFYYIANDEDYRNFIKKVYNRIKSQIKFILNISGGYKVIIPYLTIIGQIKNIDLAYIHEEGTDLIKISELPINFDMNIVLLYYDLLKKSFHSKDKRVYSKFSDYEILVLKKLEKMLLITFNENYYKITPLGEIMVEFAYQESTFSEKVFGHFIESKIFEYYVKDNFSTTPQKYKNIIHSKSVIKNNKVISDVDVYLETTTEKICVEIKSYRGFTERLNDCKYQAKKIVENESPNKYIFYVYLFYDPKISSLNDEKVELEKSYQSMKSHISSISLEAYFIPIPIDPNNELQSNPYDDFIKNELTTFEYISNFNSINELNYVD